MHHEPGRHQTEWKKTTDTNTKTVQLLELYDEDFKTLVKKKNALVSITNMLGKKWKNRKPQQVQYLKMNQTAILELKSTMSEIKRTQWMASTARWRGRRKASLNLKSRKGIT